MRARHPDLIDWFRLNSVALKRLRAERYALEKGFFDYSKDVSAFVREYREGRKKRKEEKVVEAKLPTPAEEEFNRNMYQQAASLDLLRKMKWERVKWSPDADYDGFARRLSDNDNLFKRIPSFSFMKIDICKDPSSFSIPKTQDFGSVSPGDVASWICSERSCASTKLFSAPRPTQAPYSVDWVTGKILFLDSITANEVQTFLTTQAPQAMALQVRLDDEQKKIATDLELLRLRSGVLRFQYNHGDNVSHWQDSRRFTDSTYVTPSHLRLFIDGLLQGASTYRWYLSGHEVRIVHPSIPFSIDSKEKVISIPANFSDSNWVSLHVKAAALERVLNGCRRFWYMWFAFAVMLFGGDFDIY